MLPSAAADTLLPRMGLGMAALGRPGYINLDRASVFGGASDPEQQQRSWDQMQRQANAVLDQLFHLCNSTDGTKVWIDCARSYGKSEEFVGDYLRNHPDTLDVVVSSKWGYTYVANGQVALPPGVPHEVKDHSVTNFEKQRLESEHTLRRDGTQSPCSTYLQLYQVHSATFESGILADTETHQALAQAKQEQGYRLGLSVSGPQQAEVIRAALKLRNPANQQNRLFDAVQCTWNILEQSAGEALLEAYEQAGWEIIIKEGLANGRALKVVERWAQKLGMAPDTLALAVILAQPFQPRVLSGAVTPEQLVSNWQALDVQLEESLVEKILRECRMESQEYWTERSALAWN